MTQSNEEIIKRIDRATEDKDELQKVGKSWDTVVMFGAWPGWGLNPFFPVPVTISTRSESINYVSHQEHEAIVKDLKRQIGRLVHFEESHTAILQAKDLQIKEMQERCERLDGEQIVGGKERNDQLRAWLSIAVDALEKIFKDDSGISYNPSWPSDTAQEALAEFNGEMGEE